MGKNDYEIVLLHDLPAKPALDSSGLSDPPIEPWAGEYYGQYFKNERIVIIPKRRLHVNCQFGALVVNM
jgi:hypothetical protein